MTMMKVKRLFSLSQSFKCLFSSISNAVTITKSKKITHGNMMEFFLKENPQILQIQEHIPEKYFAVARRFPNNVYLICPKTANKIAKIIMPYLNLSSNQLIAETNAGLGLIAEELLEIGVPIVRLYESCSDFTLKLKSFADQYPGQIELFAKDIFRLPVYDYVDKKDNGNRVDTLLSGVPKRSWRDDPVMSIIGCMSQLNFLKYLVKSLCFQRSPVTYGRIQIFAMIQPRLFHILTATRNDNLFFYKNWTIMFNLIFNFELMDKFPRSVFLPWVSKNVTKMDTADDEMYLVRINFKKELPIESEKMIYLVYFLIHFYQRGNNLIIPTVEKWVPNTGHRIIAPTLKHEDYFENIGIFTKFRELTPNQILSVFKELDNCPTYSTSPFMAMVDNALIKSETIETSLADSKLEKKIIEDIEVKLDK